MTQLTHTSEFPATAPEQIEHFAKLLRKSEIKRQIFAEVYRGQSTKPKVPAQIALAVGSSVTGKRVAELATPLAHAGLFEIVKDGNRVAYRKHRHIATVRDKILSLARDAKKLAKHVTVRTAGAPKKTISVKVLLSSKNVSVRYITIDDIDNFKKVRNIKMTDVPEKLAPEALQEKDFKAGLLKLLPGTDAAKDWGGEANDIFTDKLYLRGKRMAAAFALKGPFAGGKITPGKMGKNGDQLQRLVASGSQAFFVQSEMAIAQSVYEQLQQLAQAKSALTRTSYYYGVINRADSYRLRLAYPMCF